jgi:S-sulfo-L-cysteine synthase (O-acetyl-L-serine-dependent)
MPPTVAYGTPFQQITKVMALVFKSRKQQYGEQAQGEMVPVQTVLERVGNTPLLHLARLSEELPGVELLAKAEWFNPGGSVKDRAASAIVSSALAGGELPRKALLDATSGNTGIAYAMIGAARGFDVTLCVPASASQERKRTLRAYGAEILYTPADEGSDGAIRKARQLAAEHPQRYFYADQYSNHANWRAHYEGTAEEIWRQTAGRVTHFVAVLGTSGTFIGTARRLKELNPKIECVSLQPAEPLHGIEGAKHMGSSLVPAIYDAQAADRDLAVATEEAHRWVKLLAREEGLLVGVSSGAAVAGCLRVAQGAPEGSVIVTVFPDGGDKYLSEPFWEEE